MYNYQKFLKQSKHASQLRKLQRLEREQQSHREQLARTLIANHDKRIEHSILTLIEHPQRVNDYRDPAYRPREEDKSKRVVDGEMVYNYEKEPVRITRNVYRNASLDLVPFKNASLYQFRESTQGNSNRKSLACPAANRGETGTEVRESICSQVKQAQGRCSRVSRLPIILERLPKTYFHTLQTIVNKPETLRITIDEKGNESLSISHSHADGRIAEMQGRVQAENRAQRERIKEQKLRKCKKALQKCGVIPEEALKESRMERYSSMR